MTNDDDICFKIKNHHSSHLREQHLIYYLREAELQSQLRIQISSQIQW